MKVFKITCLLVSIIATSFFFACSSDDDKENTVVDTIGEKYFKIENASFVENDLPVGTTDLISTFNFNQHVINGGSTMLSFTSAQKLKTAYVGVKGVKGFYQFELPNVSPKSSATAAATYSYDVVLQINQDIVAKDFAVSLSVANQDGQVSPMKQTEDIAVVEAGIGDLQISVSWDQLDDVDLHVINPDGIDIYFGNPLKLNDSINLKKYDFDFMCYLVDKYTDHDISNLVFDNVSDSVLLDNYLDDISASFDLREENYKFATASKYVVEGYLDIDSNAGCAIDAVNNENIFFKSVKNGTYTIKVDLYEKCDLSKPGAKYSVSLNYKGTTIKFADKQVGQFADNNEGNFNVESGLLTIGTFEVTDGVKSAGTKSARTMSPDMYKRIKMWTKK